MWDLGTRPKDLWETAEKRVESLIQEDGSHLGLPPLRDRTYLVTGSTKGIGLYTVKLLLKEGCRVLVHGRRGPYFQSRVESLIWELTQGECGEASVKASQITGLEADLALMSEVRDLGKLVREEAPVLHGVLHNAASFNSDFKGGKRRITPGVYERNEWNLAVNTMAPFLLTSELLPSLRASGAGRVIFSGSESMHDVAEFLPDLQLETTYSMWRAYALSKLCNAMMAAEMDFRYGDAPNLTFHCIHPGHVDTKLARHGAAWASGKGFKRHWRKARGGAGRGHGELDGTLPHIKTATKSFYSLTENYYQEVSGTILEGAPPEVFDEKLRAKLWDDLVELTQAKWPEPLKSLEGAAEPLRIEDASREEAAAAASLQRELSAEKERREEEKRRQIEELEDSLSQRQPNMDATYATFKTWGELWGRDPDNPYFYRGNRDDGLTEEEPEEESDEEPEEQLDEQLEEEPEE